jgi:hypothetical protein
MAIQKRKAVAKISAGASPSKRSRALLSKVQKAAEKEEREDEEAEENVDEEQEEQEEEDNEEDDEEEISEEDRIAKEEEETTAARKKELKGIYIDELKQLATSKGLEACKKEDMIEAVLALEAKERADARAKKAKMRAAVVSKKDELEALPLPELRDVCNDYGIKGQLTKQARIEQILKLWQAANGVDKALAKMARDEREQELVAMDKASLRRLCETAGVDPLVKQIMVERLVRVEGAAGKFARPSPAPEPVAEEEKPKKAKKVDMVDALLEEEAQRKRDLELKRQQEEAAAAKLKDLKAMSVEDLKKALTKKGADAIGKKDDMVEALYQLNEREEAASARKKKLSALPLDDLKKLMTSQGLPAGKKDDMISEWFAHEARLLEAVKVYEARVGEVLAKRKEELEAKTANELKDMCAEKSLKLGAGKEGRIETLLEDIKASGELEKAVAAVVRQARTDELMATAQAEVLKLCETAEVDPLVKEILIERLLAHEAEFGRVEAPKEPKAKRARKA